MKKLFFYLSLITSFLISSCAPTIFQPEYCQNRFKEQKNIDNGIPESFSFSGSALISGIPLIIRGRIDKNQDSIDFSSPFGKNILSIDRKDTETCIKMSGFRSCDGEEIMSLISLYMPQAKPIADINLLKSLISKKFYLNDSDKYQCNSKELKVIRKEYSLVYEDKNLSRVIYRDYTVEYGLNNQIEIKNQNSTLVKINLSSINFNN